MKSIAVTLPGDPEAGTYRLRNTRYGLVLVYVVRVTPSLTVYARHAIPGRWSKVRVMFFVDIHSQPPNPEAIAAVVRRIGTPPEHKPSQEAAA
jgi:hypothetical protein